MFNHYPYESILIITKGKFGAKIVNTLTLPVSFSFKLDFWNLDRGTFGDLSNYDMVIVVADKITEKEWTAICQATPSFVVAIGTTVPEEIKFDTYSIYETSVKVYSKTLQSFINAISYSNCVRCDIADIRAVLRNGRQSKAIYIESMMDLNDLTKLVVKQLTDAKMSSIVAKEILLSLFLPENFIWDEVNKIEYAIYHYIDVEGTIVRNVFCDELDDDKEEQKYGLSLVISY